MKPTDHEEPEDIEDTEDSASDEPLPSREEFLDGRRRRYGKTHPEVMDVPFWDYMVRTKVDPYFLRETYGCKRGHYEAVYEQEQQAIWSFARIGMTTTLYEDSLRISIGGEYDDWYHPDFLIYNDVVVRDDAGNVTIYGYPKDVFPPTDFHTATLVPDDSYSEGVPFKITDGIIIIGCVGYPDDREFWRTPVYRLDLQEFHIWPLECSGDEPGWISQHNAALLSKGRILVEGGRRLNENGDFVPNEDEFILDLTSLRWTKRSGAG